MAEVPKFDPMGQGLTAEYAQYGFIIRHIEEMGYKLPEEA